MQNILSSLAKFDQCRIAVIGDLMLDEYLWGHIERISPEAPVPILNVIRRESMLGGAGNVVENLRCLGAKVTVFGLIGPDDTGEQVRELLKTHGADLAGVITDANRRSTRKVRLMSLEHGQQVFRLDEESTQPTLGEIEDRLVNLIRTETLEARAIVCSDYLKGVLTERVLSAAFAAARAHGIPCIVGPKDSNSRKYQGASMLMPNTRELAQLAGAPVDGDGWLNDSAHRLVDRLGLDTLIVTRGGEGMSLFENQGNTLRRVDIPTMARSVYDVTGAGDTAIATFAAAVASGSDCENAVRLANLAAGIKVGKRGTACVSLNELKESLAERTSSDEPQASLKHVRPAEIAVERARGFLVRAAIPAVRKDSF
jgi:D-beta-D-heptose 7-phosphate kinase/D-beta-D-heptose 1-phosphate adenosyltransferase